jgi:hypothetical protein
MKYFSGLLFLFLFSFVTASAYELFVTEVERPYDVVPITPDEYNKQVHLGSLDDFPVMYEFSVESTSSLSLQLSEVYKGVEPTGFSLMIVKQNDDGSGVTEVVRQMSGNNDWSVRKDSAYGLTFREGDVLVQEFVPGTYSLEVSTPVNQGKYLLSVGSESDSLNYFETLSRVKQIQSHFEYSFLKILTSSYVYYPLGIILLLFAIQRTQKYRKKIAHVD